MGFEIGSGQGSAQRKGGLVPEGLQVARLVDVEERASKNPDWGTNYCWEVELFNSEGENGWARLWTNKTLAANYTLAKLVEALGVPHSDVLKPSSDGGGVFALIGVPFKIMVEHVIKQGDDGPVTYGNVEKYFKSFEGESPFTVSVEELLAAEANASTEADDIPF